MELNLHWTVKIPAPKNKEKLLETQASLYTYENMYRVCFKNQKQVYYFEFPINEKDTKDIIKEVALQYFSANRNFLDISKCIRCSKWAVEAGQMCERCQKATENTDFEKTTNTILEIET